MIDAHKALARARGAENRRGSIDQELLDVTQRTLVNALPWRGQFPPELPQVFLEAHTPRGLVVDPFAGSGGDEEPRAGVTESCMP